MPELPEVETIRAGIADHAVGGRIESVEVFSDRAMRRQQGGRDEFAALLAGRTLTGARRRGKFLWLTLDHEGEEALLIHLGMSGQVLVRERTDDAAHLPAHARVRLTLAGGPGNTGVPGRTVELLFVDQRTFGYMWAGPLTPEGLPEPVAHIGRDLLDPALAAGTADYSELVRAIRGTGRGIKTVLLDQRVLSGIGNIYADEALWRARLHYATPAERLRPIRAGELLESARDVLTEALAAGGTSFDALYVDVAGDSGYFERELAVYGREGLPCGRCGRAIVREPWANRSSFRCPACQRKR
ncbi:bifunctional DNA-formamidopyrimidine glycosylase/DNA-(apurinic or apyrimidinic site) lyase [Pseudactinotalea sp. HY158]|uniref:bifunctional DNA-formamidopyrimidine glycosylase/DNA-(apurinic or apyrimidinic site) lyase n=1 Tax=Pseudactinotalea sp. HY158 TaxID=2654547 RepID=UPI00129CE197|nr:bifunctional DNA-formamidopyrimidine glycosylase/DNA-(apurinic or apyrimidinic site) lyase [Pseudactinotalea sp. HY158]QGH69010.1 bifunctional DNA-formamidopyrimidine glycosylase/DNA-(apurinic or apyrimidinic site) lyase [Pseudactinotalea sp. HY158]